MAKFAFLVELKAKPGKESEIEAFLKKEAALVRGEAGTLSWHAAKVEGEPGVYRIFDTFIDEAAREAHLNGEAGKEFAANAEKLGVGESANDCLVRFPSGDFASSVELTPYTLPDGTSGTNVHVKADKYRYLVAADVPESVVDLMIATQRPIALAALNEKLTSAAWTSKPSWQIRPLLDPVIPVAEFKFEADRAHSHVIELNSSHAIPITYPGVVVDVIEQDARATMK